MSSGIYMLYSKADPKKTYIGSCVDFTARRMLHEAQLHNGTHHNSHLQNHCNKYGVDDIMFLIVKFCPRDQLIEEEQKYLDMLKPAFNICYTAGSRLGCSNTPQSKNKQRARMKVSRNPTQYEKVTGKFVVKAFHSRKKNL